MAKTCSPNNNTFAILRLDNDAELTTIQKVSKNANRLKFAQGFVDRFLNIFPCVLNNKLKVLKRRCYGLDSVRTLFQRLWLDLEGYRAFGKT